MDRAVIVDAVRTPIGKYSGVLKDIRPDDLAALAISALLERTGIDPGSIDDVYLGAANQAGEDNRNVARMAALLAGLPVTVPGATMNRLCGSGLQAIISAAREIQVGNGDVYVAGGVESMTRAPYVMLKPEGGYLRRPPELYDTTVGWRMVNPRMAEMYPPISLGETAERVAERYSVSRAEQDEFALASHQKAVQAQISGRFSAEIIPVEVEKERGEAVTVATDEGPRPDTSPEKLSRLKPAFVKDGTVTAGNSSQINDGASAVLMLSERRAEALGLTPLATFVAGASAGVDPSIMGMGPVPATRKVMALSGLDVSAFDLVELNEAFASQSIACIRELGLDPSVVNVNGGAIALGHPLGASGSRLVTTLLQEMRRRESRVGLATMCVGVGQGISALFEAWPSR
ncbi:MAG TPA: thiolase family protein [Chloroflexota bacterium]|nr:thiolase family protein [Chloroflexota bacterium]